MSSPGCSVAERAPGASAAARGHRVRPGHVERGPSDRLTFERGDRSEVERQRLVHVEAVLQAPPVGGQHVEGEHGRDVPGHGAEQEGDLAGGQVDHVGPVGGQLAADLLARDPAPGQVPAQRPDVPGADVRRVAGGQAFRPREGPHDDVPVVDIGAESVDAGLDRVTDANVADRGVVARPWSTKRIRKPIETL